MLRRDALVEGIELARQRQRRAAGLGRVIARGQRRSENDADALAVAFRKAAAGFDQRFRGEREKLVVQRDVSRRGQFGHERGMIENFAHHNCELMHLALVVDRRAAVHE